MNVTARNCLSLAAIAVAGLLLASCGDDAAFGFREARSEPAPDFSGSDQPAPLGTPELAAKTSLGLIQAVEAMALVLGEIGDATGDLFPEEDHPCPQGGSASSELGGSFSEPELDLRFNQCVRGDNTLDGRALIHCEDFSGSACDGGRVSLGEGGVYFHVDHLSPGAAGAMSVLIQGDADLRLDQGAGRLQAISWQRGAIQRRDSGARIAFINDGLVIDLHKLNETQTEIRLDGISALGGAESETCTRGRFDTESPEPLLRNEDGRYVAGTLRLHSPAPRPGTQQAVVRFLAEGLEAQGADGGQRVFTDTETSAYCR